MPPTPRAAKAATDPTAEQQELERLRQQVATLQADADKRDAEEGQTPAYEHLAAGTGHLEERLARVTGHVSRIPKRGFNNEQKYNFVAHSDVLDSIRPALAAESVQFRSRITLTEAEPELQPDGNARRTGGGMVWRMWRIEVTFTFTCWMGEKRCEQVTEGWPGYAQDYSDKGASKALTSAIKTFLIQQFLISTGDDPDEPTPEQGNNQQQARQSSQGRSTDPRDNELRLARRACMDYNEKLPKGVLGKIAKRVTGSGLVIQIENAAQLKRIAKIAEAYVENPEKGEAWLAGETQQQSGEPEPEDAARQEAAEAPDVPVAQRDLSQPLVADPVDGSGADALPAEPVTPLPVPEEASDEERRQAMLGIPPAPPSTGDDDDIPF